MEQHFFKQSPCEHNRSYTCFACVSQVCENFKKHTPSEYLLHEFFIPLDLKETSRKLPSSKDFFERIQPANVERTFNVLMNSRFFNDYRRSERPPYRYSIRFSKKPERYFKLFIKMLYVWCFLQLKK